jgi:hypothetical protein
MRLVSVIDRGYRRIDNFLLDENRSGAETQRLGHIGLRTPPASALGLGIGNCPIDAVLLCRNNPSKLVALEDSLILERSVVASVGKLFDRFRSRYCTKFCSQETGSVFCEATDDDGWRMLRSFSLISVLGSLMSGMLPRRLRFLEWRRSSVAF